MLSDKLKRWLENNVDLLDDLSIDELWGKCPAELYGELYTVLETAGIDLDQRGDDMMWGIKSNDGRYTLSLGKHNKINFNVNHTASQGMKRGMQIGFKSLASCMKFLTEAEKRYPHIHLRPSRMQKKIVDSYVWSEADTIYGKCYVTNLAIDAYDPIISKQRREQKKQEKKLHDEFVTLWSTKIQSLIDRQYIKDSINAAFGDVVDFIFFYTDYKELGIYINVPYNDPKVKDIVNLLSSLVPLKFDVTTKLEYYGRSSIWLNFENSAEYQTIKYQVYGV